MIVYVLKDCVISSFGEMVAGWNCYDDCSCVSPLCYVGMTLCKGIIYDDCMI